MTLVIVTLATSLIVNAAVLLALKIGLRNGQGAGGWAGRQPC
jgi:hypothetical protein